MKLSVIIPVYNTLEYLTSCLNSVLNQPFVDLEVIVVNDGSSDGSHILLEYYQKNYPNVSLIHQENAGLSHSRNQGLLKATGEYVLFLDSDDKFLPDTLFNLLTFLSVHQPDVCVMNWMSYHSGRVIKYYEYGANKKLKTINKTNGKDFVINMLKKDRIWELFAWNMCYKRDYLIKENHQFVKGILFEDMIWNWEILLKAPKVLYYEKPVVLYTRKREGQITRQISKKSVMDRIFVSDYWTKNIDSFNLNQNERYYFLTRISNLYFSSIFLAGALSEEERLEAVEKMPTSQHLLNYAPNAVVASAYDLVKRIGFDKATKIIGKKASIFFKL